MTPVKCWAPGRVNLIGEHIDYCGGTVLPMPIQFGTAVSLEVRADDRIVAISDSQPEPVTFRRDEPCPVPVDHWGRYVYGAVQVVDAPELSGFEVSVHGDIPGSGLSSSASLCVALIGAIYAAHGLAPSPLEIAHRARRVEHDYTDVFCGLMDQAAVTLGEPGAALYFDCAAETWSSCRFGQGAPRIVVIDSGVPRRLADSAYNQRLAEVGRAAEALGRPVESLARARTAELEQAMARIDAIAYQRARHVISEQQRVARAVEQIELSQWSDLGRTFDASHASLRDDYEVSCDELDLLTDLLRPVPEVLGARLTGAGFGGSAVALVDSDNIADVLAAPLAAYQQRTGLNPRWFEARSNGGLRSERT